ncbi:5-amino-6-(5-phospho-D-ribitylamino)uracil phosphatase YigB [Tepidimonas thermarum]|uniref:5-amino-6-(5-phospho-D-ribitylamino)uracil phosphatase YigB n=1 Tax=Tepidimonas thermarum TaxID=335431 RepID=A0A554WZY7_9BURK|nr:HAD-IA family hydrolase [Tepidimonas thermarum]TSE29075.1 5-amino-6-(5-phospho-D-ribitylamino)uracil phosphatase YigB [Tepidimonas thermarum]
MKACAGVGALTLDLDDTLWPMRPTIERAEATLQSWLVQHAPNTAARLCDRDWARAVRAGVQRDHPDRHHDLSFLRREAIRVALQACGDDPALADPAFEVFYAERQRVELYPDVLPALERLASRWRLVAVTNGNADVERVGLGRWFVAQVSAREAGVAKPHPRIYHQAAHAAGVAPQDVLHVGDDPLLDVVAARRAGLQTAWVNRHGLDWTFALQAPAPRGDLARALHTQGVQPQGHEAPHLQVPDLQALCERLLAS